MVLGLQDGSGIDESIRIVVLEKVLTRTEGVKEILDVDHHSLSQPLTESLFRLLLTLHLLYVTRWYLVSLGSQL